MKLSEFVKKYREENNLSQRELARRCDLSHGLISLIEKDTNPQTGKPMRQDIDCVKFCCTTHATTHNLEWCF